MKRRRMVWGLPGLALAAALLVVLARHNHRLGDPNTRPDTRHASWRGYDSGYEHPSSRSSEDANANKR
jgi:hypothetical protein